MKRLSIFILGVVATFMLAPTVQVEARDQISIVGSSTVYPYGTVNAKDLVKKVLIHLHTIQQVPVVV